MTIAIVIIGLVVLILAHEFGHFITAKIFGVMVEEFGIGYPPRLFGKKIGETTYSVNLLPLGGFVRIHGEEDAKKDEGHAHDETLDIFSMERSFAHQSLWKRAVILIAGVAMNMVVGWFILSGIFMTGTPAHLAVADVAKDSPAYAAGIMQNDFIIKAKLGNTTLHDPIKSDEFISVIKNVAGEKVLLTVTRDGKTLDFEVPSRANPPEGEGSLGVVLTDAGITKQSLWKSIGSGFTASISIFWLTVQGFFALIIGLFSSPASAFQNVAGPIGIFGIATQTGKMGLIYLFQLVALISINLSVLNLIPFPALDGGRVLFLIIEKIKGSPISSKTQQRVNMAGFAILLLLMAFVTVHDIGAIIRK